MERDKIVITIQQYQNDPKGSWDRAQREGHISVVDDNNVVVLRLCNPKEELVDIDLDAILTRAKNWIEAHAEVTDQEAQDLLLQLKEVC